MVCRQVPSLKGPRRVGTVRTSEQFQSLFCEKIATRMDRDTAVAMVRSARLHEGDAPVWATQDLPVPIRVRIFSLRLA